MINRQAKGQVEVTVVEGSITAYAQLVAAHQPGDGLRVKRGAKELEILLFLLMPAQFLLESPQGHIGDGEQSGKEDAEAFAKFPPIIVLQASLRGR